MQIYVSISDSVQNLLLARIACKFVIDMGHIPICPYLSYGQVLDLKDSQELDKYLKLSEFLISPCEEVWLFGEKLYKPSFEEKKLLSDNPKVTRRITNNHIRLKQLPIEV